jgi:hypothetical protein
MKLKLIGGKTNTMAPREQRKRVGSAFVDDVIRRELEKTGKSRD